MSIFPKFQISKSTSNNQYYYRLRAKGNGEIILSGEGYTTKQSCLGGIAAVRVNAPYDSRYDRRNGLSNFTFNLKAPNGEIIGRSENYTTSSNRENGIEAVKRDAPSAPIEDLT
ncbi:YegP family protein [Rufibacter sp. LB8]|uniref:YegP family protein n=1 Tax=Rufibacter sp. LB8 TaxID=2777781 RepID=UPI00178C2FDD|nr:YegP family protein [Rufibacter sp. LB8]